MQVKLNSDTIWINVMPRVGADDDKPVEITAKIELDQILPEGAYTIKVLLHGQDGTEQTADAEFNIAHAS